MKKIASYEGSRVRTGVHTGYAVFKDEKDVLWLSSESGLRRLSEKEIEAKEDGE